jgi:CDGSH-type Zn-finger protein
MSEAVIASKTPFQAEVVAGKTYYWCQCGRSKNQPYCDGAHAETSLTPIAYDAETDGTVYFCGCKQTSNQPLCDGSHQKID